MAYSKYRARKTSCSHGHKHDSAKEARRCNDLHLLEIAGEISHLETHVKIEFIINGAPVKMRNGQNLRYTPDFRYFEGDKQIVEDVKGGPVTADFRVRAALFRHLNPMTELRIT